MSQPPSFTTADKSVCAVLVHRRGAEGAVRVTGPGTSHPVPNVITGPDESGWVIVAVKEGQTCMFLGEPTVRFFKAKHEWFLQWCWSCITYWMKTVARGWENSILAVDSANWSKEIQIEGKGSPDKGHSIWRVLSDFWYSRRKLARSLTRTSNDTEPWRGPDGGWGAVSMACKYLSSDANLHGHLLTVKAWEWAPLPTLWCQRSPVNYL